MSMNTSQRKQQGFSLTELLITIAILGILSSLAIAGWGNLTANNRAFALSNDVVAMLNHARQEAIHRGLSVSVCPPTDSTYTACGTDWSKGYFAFVNGNEDGIFANDSDEILLKTRAALPTGASISTTPSREMLTFNSRGFPVIDSKNVTIHVSDSKCVGNRARDILINATGRVSVTLVACP